MGFYDMEPVLVVLKDSRFLKTVLPLLDGNQRFWESWDELNIESQCVNAYTPPVKKLKLPTPYVLGVSSGSGECAGVHVGADEVEGVEESNGDEEG
jgi:hypothetical protein